MRSVAWSAERVMRGDWGWGEEEEGGRRSMIQDVRERRVRA